MLHMGSDHGVTHPHQPRRRLQVVPRIDIDGNAVTAQRTVIEAQGLVAATQPFARK